MHSETSESQEERGILHRSVVRREQARGCSASTACPVHLGVVPHLVQQLIHSVHTSLSDSSLLLSTAAKDNKGTRSSMCLDCLFERKTAVDTPSSRLASGAAAQFCR